MFPRPALYMYICFTRHFGLHSTPDKLFNFRRKYEVSVFVVYGQKVKNIYSPQYTSTSTLVITFPFKLANVETDQDIFFLRA